MYPSLEIEDPSDHPLARLTPLAPPPHPKPVPTTAFDAMIGMYRMGTGCESSPVARLEKIARACDPTVSLLLQGAFLCGVGARGNDPRTGWSADRESLGHCCAGLKLLARAFLEMTRKDREHAFVAAKSDAGCKDLVISVVGALCEAHVASAMSDAGMSVFEGAVDDDIELEVDQIATFPDMSDGLLVQVKGDRDWTGLEFVPIIGSPVTNATLAKAERFNLANKVRFTPVLARLGTGSGALFGYRDPDRLEAAKRSLALLRGPA